MPVRVTFVSGALAYDTSIGTSIGPHLNAAIRFGSETGQYLWRALGEGPRGIIAVGTVAEPPRKYSPATVSQFKRPDRLEIGEEAASSGWKNRYINIRGAIEGPNWNAHGGNAYHCLPHIEYSTDASSDGLPN